MKLLRGKLVIFLNTMRYLLAALLTLALTSGTTEAAKPRKLNLKGPPAACVGLNAGALEIECDRDLIPATVQLADKVFLGNAHVVEEDLAEARLACHVDERPHGDAGRVHLDRERADPLVFRRLGVRPGGEPRRA